MNNLFSGIVTLALSTGSAMAAASPIPAVEAEAQWAAKSDSVQHPPHAQPHQNQEWTVFAVQTVIGATVALIVFVIGHPILRRLLMWLSRRFPMFMRESRRYPIPPGWYYAEDSLTARIPKRTDHPIEIALGNESFSLLPTGGEVSKAQLTGICLCQANKYQVGTWSLVPCEETPNRMKLTLTINKREPVTLTLVPTI